MARQIDNSMVQKPLFTGRFFTSSTIVEESLVKQEKEPPVVNFYDF